MTDYILPFGFALLTWWLSTGVILYLNHLPRDTYRWSMLVASCLLAACLYGLHTGSSNTTEMGALIAFSQALLVWAWLEISYFMGFVTGPCKLACPSDITGWARFRMALKTSLHHEAAVVALGVSIILLTWDAPNQFGTWTFVTLWSMRWSAKLNLFLGVPNVNEDWFPVHLRFLTTYMRRRSMNLLFPIVITASTMLVTWLFLLAVMASDDFNRTGFTLVASLMALAVLEHWFLVLPLHDTALWNWALRLAGKTAAQHAGRSASPSYLRKPAVWRRRSSDLA